jgi:hypothetical protein
MGMYDEIKCGYPLPTESPFESFQTKSLDCVMAAYEITADGRLLQTAEMFGKLDKPEDVPFTGIIEFYNSNACASAFGHLFTSNGEDYESVEYEATFDKGVVTKIVETEHIRKVALSREFYHEADKVIDKEAPEIDETEPDVGMQLWRLWGGFDSKPYAVTLAIKTAVEWGLTDERGRIEQAHPSDLGRILFRTKEDADVAGRWRKEGSERKTQWCRERLAEKMELHASAGRGDTNPT